MSTVLTFAALIRPVKNASSGPPDVLAEAVEGEYGALQAGWPVSAPRDQVAGQFLDVRLQGSQAEAGRGEHQPVDRAVPAGQVVQRLDGAETVPGQHHLPVARRQAVTAPW